MYKRFLFFVVIYFMVGVCLKLNITKQQLKELSVAIVTCQPITASIKRSALSQLHFSLKWNHVWWTRHWSEPLFRECDRVQTVYLLILFNFIPAPSATLLQRGLHLNLLNHSTDNWLNIRERNEILSFELTFDKRS